MHVRAFAIAVVFASLVCGACGGSPRGPTADLAAVRQPTPDPTLDAVVRDLPRVLAGVLAPTPTPTAVAVSVPTPKPKQAAPSPTIRAPVRATPVAKPHP